MLTKPKGKYSLATVCREFYNEAGIEISLSQVLKAISENHTQLYMHCPENLQYRATPGTAMHQYPMYQDKQLLEVVNHVPGNFQLIGHIKVVDPVFLDETKRLLLIEDQRNSLAMLELERLYPVKLMVDSREANLTYVAHYGDNPECGEPMDTRSFKERYFVDGEALYDYLIANTTEESIQLANAHKRIAELEKALIEAQKAPGNGGSVNTYTDAIMFLAIALIKERNKNLPIGQEPIKKVTTSQILSALSSDIDSERLPSETFFDDRRKNYVVRHTEKSLYLN